METGPYLLSLINLAVIGVLPFAVFRRGGQLNLSWWLTAAPFFASGLALIAACAGLIAPVIGTALAPASAPLSLLSLALIVWTARVHPARPALWHQEADTPRRLVTDGPYGRIRHPFYTAFLMALLAAGLALPHPATWGALLWALVALNWTAAREETRLLGSSLGAAYGAYLSGTGRFLPSIRRAVP